MKKPFKIYFKPDLLFAVLLILLTVLTVLGAVLQSLWLLLLAVPLAVFSIYRVLSGNLAARARENQITKRILFFVPLEIKKLYFCLFPDKSHGFAFCPTCSARLRFPKTRGSFYLTCPRCQTRFPVNMK